MKSLTIVNRFTRVGRNAPCPCGKRNEKSLEWRMVDGDLKQVPRPMKFKNCCHPSARAARRYIPSAFGLLMPAISE
jgi:hypothetical protein